jgi:hypothetical protein
VHEAGKAACSVAALFNFTAVGIVNAVEELAVGLLRWFNDQQLIATDATMAIGETTHQFCIERDRLVDGINDDKVIAEAVHFAEVEEHGAKGSG